MPDAKASPISDRNSELIPQPGGRGALLRGGKKGNRGGGRMPDKLREELKRVGARGIAQVVAPYIDDQLTVTVGEHGVDIKPDPALRLKAVDLALRYGLGPLQGIPQDDVTDRLKQTIELIKERVPDPESALIIDRMRKIWA